MSYTIKWRKAMFVSFFLHLFVLPILGYFTAGLSAVPEESEEILIEMSLADPVSSTPNQQGAQELSSLAQPPSPTVTPLSPQPNQPSTSSPTPTVITTSELIMTAADIEPAAAVSESTGNANESSSNSSSTSSSAAPMAAGGSSSGSNAGSSQSDIVKPSVVFEVPPNYPSSAKQNNLEGTVVLRVQILTSGQPGSISVAQSSGYDSLDEAAIAAMRQWQFIPAKNLNTGKAVAVYIKKPITFTLH